MVFHDLGSKFNLQQNGYHLNALFMLITMVQILPSYLIPSPRYLANLGVLPTKEKKHTTKQNNTTKQELV